jgi:tetratricopeptide (TPR) repeat protein
MSRFHFGSICALGFLCLIPGCRRSGVQSCLDLVEAKQYEAAAQRCEDVYTAEGDPRAGAAAVKSFYHLGQEEKVLSWVDHLRQAGKVTPGVWGFAARVHQQRGEAEKAEEEYRRDLALWRAAGDHRKTADTLYRLFYLAWGRSGHSEVLALASEAFQEAVKARDRDLQARAAQALYTVLIDVGDLEGARRALETASGLIDPQDRISRAHLRSNLGTLLFAEGRLALARRYHEQALELGREGTEEFLRGVHINLAEVHLLLGDTDRAAHHLTEAWKHVDPREPTPSSMLYFRARVEFARGRLAQADQALATALSQDPEPDWTWQLAYQQGLLAEVRGHHRTAESAYRRSIEIIEDLRRSVPSNEFKAWLLDQHRQPFEALFRLQARAGRGREALATAERAQARTFLDAFLHASSAEGLSGKPWSTGASLQRITGLESLLPAMSESSVAALQPIDQVLSAFGSRHGLVYFESGDDLWLIVVRGRRLHLHRLAASTPEVRRLAERFLVDPGETRAARRLGEILLPPDSLPAKGEPVYVVADGILGNLPFGALRREERYLVEDHAILFVPSLGALAAIERRPPEQYEPPLVLADPRGDLPAAASEGMEMGNLLHSAVRTAGQATSGELKRAVRARVLHLAAHTGVDARGPWLQLADRDVSASEIITGRIGPRLVVLASCSSGVRPGRQLWGSLGAAFLAAGSRAVVASLWSIEDERARELVLRFYREGGAADPSGALARAQRVAIRRGQSPTFWAPFVFFGSEQSTDALQ